MRFLDRVFLALAALLLVPLQGATATVAAQERPAWQQLPLTNARTGEVFTLAGLAGKTVFVEPMATWCTNCRQQMNVVRQVRGQVNGDQNVFIALSVETNVSNEALARYADEAGFDWLFAVMSPELLRELSATFGQSITNPPATPHFVLRPDGSTTALSTGHHSAESIIQELAAASQ